MGVKFSTTGKLLNFLKTEIVGGNDFVSDLPGEMYAESLDSGFYWQLVLSLKSRMNYGTEGLQ